MAMFGNLSTMGQVSGRDFAAKLSGMSNEEVKAELEEKRKKEEEEKRRQQEYIREQKAKEAEAERLRLASIVEKGRQQAPAYRDSYEVGELTSFEEAKQAADEVYLQSWYDRANEISSKWTDEDYALIAEPQYEEYYDGPRHKKTRRVVPEGYDEYVEAQERINAGPLDFSSEETHRMLINPPAVPHRGYGKRQYWISEDNPLRQAVEAQADVMQGFLDAEGISIVRPYEDLEDFERPDPMRGEGVYLNTGTGAHIDWDAGLKRMQRYHSFPDAGIGTYSQVFIRPDPAGLGPIVTAIGKLSKNPVLTAVGVKMQGGDAKDFIKTQVGSLFLQDVLPADLLETELGDWGIDADLFGIDPEEWTEGLEKVQKGATKGKSIQDGLEKEFGIDVLGNVIQGTVDIGTGVAGELMMEGDALVANINEFVIEPLEETFDAFAKTETGQGIQQVVDVATDAYEKAKDLGQDIIDPIDTVLDVVGEKVVDPALQAGKAVGEAIVDPVDDVLDTFGEKVVDPFLQAGSDVLSAGEDVVKDIGRGLDEILDYTDVFSKGADLVTTPEFKLDVLRTPPTAQTKTQTEDLFSKELFEFDLKEQDEFSQEMLSPIMNLRRYG